MRRALGVVLVAAATLYPSAAAAQGKVSKIWLDVNFGAVTASENTFSDPAQATLFGEQAQFGRDYTVGNGTSFDIGGGYMFHKRFGAGITWATTSQGEPASLTAEVPSPTAFNTFGNAQADTADSQSRHENAVHIQAMVIVYDSGRLRVRAFGGPSHISAKQRLVDSVNYTQTWSGTTVNQVAITGSGSSEPSVSAWGYNVGGDVSYFFSHILGAGGFVRFVGASADVPSTYKANATESPAVNGITTFALPLSGSTLALKLGGFTFGGGLRLRF